MQRELGASAEASSRAITNSKNDDRGERMLRIKDQIADLQVRFSFLDDGASQRDSAIWELLGRVQQLEQRLELAESKIAKLLVLLREEPDDLPIGDADEVPPHY